MSNKVKLAIYDETLKIKIKTYPVSDSGKQIKVMSGGEGHFMPKFDNYSYLEFPRKFLLWTRGHERIYFAQKGAKKCINFKTGEVSGPDPETVKTAAGLTMLKDLGTEKHEMTWQAWLNLALSIIILLYVMGVIV